ncbi:lamin tail-like protein [Cellulophaga sp. RHA_52]|uniref:DUF5689 domain-containing protein n=1 Tax=Cellulophaga sp. RHA_52 TaxID=1250036 RepID=UPI00119C1052|nr:DUF5689 domain-containing protein [Cellulophaga sp. RHA_52]TVZ08513.1 lamin tail-like protein [Cellulophaga sp. RHA_52]
MILKKHLTISISFFLIISCVKDKDFDISKTKCSELVYNLSLINLNTITEGDITQVQEDIIIEGYIVSSDIENNFFGTIHIQDKAIEPTTGISFLVDLRDYYLQYKLGEKVAIKLKGLYIAKKNNAFVIGGVFTSFGNQSVGRLPSLQVQEHMYAICTNQTAKATKTTIEDLSFSMINTLVELDNLEFIEEELSKTFANEKEETERVLKDCLGNQIKLVNSGYADFATNVLPNKNGNVTAVLIEDKNELKLKIRTIADLSFNNNRCPPIVTEFTSTAIFFSEIADPNNNTGARFIELYNSSNESLDLNNWKINRYTNASTDISSSLDLTGYSINAKSTLVISPNKDEFITVYGFEPDISIGKNSVADSNGDDNLVLKDPFGTTIDIFGVIGEDGTNTNHEFEDGKAQRKKTISMGSSTYMFNQWLIFNDTGSSNTTNTPQNAPDDFSPKVR